MSILTLPVFGFIIGLLIIALGGGGGGYYVGILTVIFNVPPAIAAATSLATIIPTTFIGAVSHGRKGNINFKYGLIMMSGAILGAIIGSLYSDYVPAKLYNKITGILLLILSAEMIIQYRKRKKKRNEILSGEAKEYKLSNIIKALLYGLLGGAMSGLVGISGTTPIVAGLAVLGCSAFEIVGTSVFVLVGISTTGFLMHLGLGNIDWKLVGLLIAGTTSGAFLAPYLLAKVNKETFEKIFLPISAVTVCILGCIILGK